MNISLDDLTERLKIRLTLPLPGAMAHELMRATPVGSLIPKFEHKVPPKPGSVLILLYKNEHEISFPLIQRPEYSGAHSGQVSLPGGKAEPGENFIETALREGHEEIGIAPQEVEVIGRLSDFFVIPSNFLVVPVVAALRGQPIFKPDAVEVERIITGNISYLLLNESIKQKEIIAAGRFKMNAPHFEIEKQVVWGATAMMLNEFRMVLQEIV